MLCSFCILVMLLIRFVLLILQLNPRFCKLKTQHIVYVPGSAVAPLFALVVSRASTTAANNGSAALHIANAKSLRKNSVTDIQNLILQSIHNFICKFPVIFYYFVISQNFINLCCLLHKFFKYFI